MGRKNSRANRSQRAMRPQRPANRADRRSGRREYSTYEYEHSIEERHYEYGDRVKPQRYPQPVKSIYMNRELRGKNVSQDLYIDALRDCGLVIGSGSAGSGKTYLAIGGALEKLAAGKVKKIYIARPVVEAGESLGFLPGTLEQKVLPYMLPMLESIEQFVGPAIAEKLVESGTIEFVTLAHARGRTISDAVFILDEAQNTTVTQMKLALTRIGENTTMYITGDPIQSDLKERGHQGETGLEFAVRKLGGGRSRDIAVIEFSVNDAVRSPLMSEVLRLIEAPDDKPTAKPIQLNEGYGSAFSEPRVARGSLLGG